MRTWMRVGPLILFGVVSALLGAAGAGVAPSEKDGGMRLQAERIFLNDDWQAVELLREFEDPVVVAKPASLRDRDPGVVRIRNVTARSFEIRFQEWFYLDDVHGKEEVSYLVVERGRWTLPSGGQLEAGKLEVTSSLPLPQPFAHVAFRTSFSTTPVVVSAVGTFRGADPVDTRLRNLTPEGFEVIMQEQEDRGGHLAETIYWVAWEFGAGKVNHLRYEAGWHPVLSNKLSAVRFTHTYPRAPCLLADLQTLQGEDTANLRFRALTSSLAQIVIVEEQSKDPETAHAAEVMGYLVLDCRPGGGGGAAKIQLK